MSKVITAKEIASRFNLSYQVINRYTNAGLLQVVSKKGNIRMYDQLITEKRLKQILELINEGYPFVLIRKKIIGI
ncbi:MerR family transcriptional regulator [bacterium]|nr:MAG: MerR family transcriptional regulator [bacterium]